MFKKFHFVRNRSFDEFYCICHCLRLKIDFVWSKKIRISFHVANPLSVAIFFVTQAYPELTKKDFHYNRGYVEDLSID